MSTRSRPDRRFIPAASAPVARSIALPAILILSSLFSCSDEPPPSVIWITLDALRADHLSCYGYDRPTSPFLDRYAGEGVRAAWAYSQAPSTKASVAAMFTSLYPSIHKTRTHSKGARRGDVLPPKATTLAEHLQEAGYRTAGFVSNPHLQSEFGFSQGFDVYRYLSVRRVARAESVLGAGLDWLDGVADIRERPFFLYLHLMDTHHPYDPLPPYRDQFLDPGLRDWKRDVYVNGRPKVTPADEDIRFLRDLYDGTIRYADASLESFVAAVEDRGLTDNTLVLITADHGDEFMEHRGLGHGQSLFQELIHVPLILVWPRRLPAGTVIETPVAIIDMAPTILSFAGVGSGDSLMLGRDLSRLLEGRDADTGAETPAHPVFSEKGMNVKCLVVGDHKYQFMNRPGISEHLYNLSDDPGEQVNLLRENGVLAGPYAEKAEKLLARLKTADESLGFDRNSTAIDPRTRHQLEQLGYVH